MVVTSVGQWLKCVYLCVCLCVCVSVCMHSVNWEGDHVVVSMVCETELKDVITFFALFYFKLFGNLAMC